MACEGFKDLTRRTASDKILCYKAFNIAKNPKYDEYQRSLASMTYKIFDKKASGGTIKNENITNKKLSEELHKTIIRKFNKRKVQSLFIDNIWGADLADMQLIRKFNKEICFYYVLLIFSINMYGYSFERYKKVSQLLILFKIF